MFYPRKEFIELNAIVASSVGLGGFKIIFFYFDLNVFFATFFSLN